MPRELVVSPSVFRLVWTCTALSYFACGSVLAGYGLMYYFVLVFMPDLVFSIELLGINVHAELFPYMGTATLVIAIVHLYHLVRMATSSVQKRSLQLPTRESRGLTSRIAHTVGAALDSVIPPRSSPVGWTIRSLSDAGICLWKAFDVTNPNYGVVYFLRELIQTGIQTQQAYQLSARVASPWMNHTIVVLLVINCWAMPLIHYGLKIRSTPTARLLCLAINFTLDFISYITFPLALLVPYAKEFDYTIYNFTKEFWYTDMWFVQIMNEWPLLFTTSVWDGLSRLLITYSMTRTLRSISKLLQHSHLGGLGSGPTKPICSLVSPATVSVAPATSSLPFTKSFTSSLSRLPPVPVLRSRAEKWGHRVLGLWGLVVLILHIQSSSTEANPRCLVQVRPWFVRRPVCSLMEMNCYYNDRLTGNGSDFADTLDSIDSAWLSYLIVRHCPYVEITPRIRDLSWLVGIKIHNSTLVRWDEDAALTQTHHPHMLFAFLLATNISVFPPGLYHHDFPSKLRDIEFSFVNLTTIPSEVVDRWHEGMFLVMEGLQLPGFPDVLAKFQPTYYSLACNNFSAIPAAILENPWLIALVLNDNPISELQAGHSTLSTLSIVKTQIARLPLWIDVSNGIYRLDAGSTPLCDALNQRNSTGMNSEAEMELLRQQVNCTPANDLRYISHFPLTEEAINNPSRVVTTA